MSLFYLFFLARVTVHDQSTQELVVKCDIGGRNRRNLIGASKLMVDIKRQNHELGISKPFVTLSILQRTGALESTLSSRTNS